MKFTAREITYTARVKQRARARARYDLGDEVDGNARRIRKGTNARRLSLSLT